MPRDSHRSISNSDDSARLPTHIVLLIVGVMLLFVGAGAGLVYSSIANRTVPLQNTPTSQVHATTSATAHASPVLLHPLVVGDAPLLWQDWSRRVHRRACIQLLRDQCVEIQVGPPTSASLAIESASLSRAERAHSRLSWTERLAGNARPETSGRVTIRLFGVPEHVASSLGLVTA